jgi:hypothetical protein
MCDLRPFRAELPISVEIHIIWGYTGYIYKVLEGTKKSDSLAGNDVFGFSPRYHTRYIRVCSGWVTDSYWVEPIFFSLFPFLIFFSLIWSWRGVAAALQHFPKAPAARARPREVGTTGCCRRLEAPTRWDGSTIALRFVYAQSYTYVIRRWELFPLRWLWILLSKLPRLADISRSKLRAYRRIYINASILKYIFFIKKGWKTWTYL